ncbi:MAG TPA: lipid-A-disaccharide synthase [Campylobacterales bacterium]|nr:lipid-A-disaccharide synthase [Campylobacterales bacterium]
MRILVSALEPSANLHLEPILQELGDVEISGIFDERFAKPLYSSKEFSVMGILDILPKIFKAREAVKELTFLAKEVDVVLLIDAPAFNIPLAKSIRNSYPDKKIIYYILPKVWAWKRKRAKVVREYCDELCSIFPFEDRFFKDVRYVGNPLLDEITVFNDGEIKNQISFLPGSRKSEIKSLMPIFREVAKKIDSKKILVVPSFFEEDDIERLYGDVGDFEISFDMQKSISQSDFAFICSGTATLESTIIGTPFVLAYKAKKIDYFLARIFVKLPYVGLANIIMDFFGKEKIHKEYLQQEVSVVNLLDSYKSMNREKFMKKSIELKEILKDGSVKNMIKILKEIKCI